MARRIQLGCVNGWRLSAGARSVARPGRWGNPFRVGHGDDPVGRREVPFGALSVAATKNIRARTLYAATGEHAIRAVQAIESLLAQVAPLPGALLAGATDANPDRCRIRVARPTGCDRIGPDFSCRGDKNERVPGLGAVAVATTTLQASGMRSVRQPISTGPGITRCTTRFRNASRPAG